MPWSDVERLLQEFEQAARENDPVRVRELLLKAVSGFEPQCKVQDVVMKHRQLRDVLPVDATREGSHDEGRTTNIAHVH